MATPYRTRDTVRQLFDDVLIRSIIEYRRALQLIERHCSRDVASEPPLPYLDELRERLAILEDELERRNLSSTLHRDTSLP